MTTQGDERVQHRWVEASASVFDIMVLALLVDIFLYRWLFLKQPLSSHDDLWLIILGCTTYRAYRAGLIPIRPVEFLRLPVFVLALLVVCVVSMLFAGIISCLAMFDIVSLPVRIAIAIPIAILGIVVVRYLLRIVRRVDEGITRKVHADEDAEGIIYSDDISQTPGASDQR